MEGPENKKSLAIVIKGKHITGEDWPGLEHMRPEELRVYVYVANNNHLNSSTHIDNINFPKGFGFTRKDNFLASLCNLGLIKDDGDDKYTIPFNES